MKHKSMVKFFSLVLAVITFVGTAVIPVFADNESATVLPDPTQAASELPATVSPQVQIEAEDISFEDIYNSDNFDNFGFSYEEMLNNPDYFIKNENADVSIAATNSVSLSYSKISVGIGSTFTLAATTSETPRLMFWSSSDNTVASVSNGVVTGVKSGSATITVRAVFSNNENLTATCTVYVYMANGVYHIQNNNSDYYIEALNGSINPGTSVVQYLLRNTGTTADLRQMWRVYFLGNGYYSVRPFYKMDMGLTYSSTGVSIDAISNFEASGQIDDDAEWSIIWKNSAYSIQNHASSSSYLCISGASTGLFGLVTTGAYTNNDNYKWTLSIISDPPMGVDLYDTTTGARLSSTPTRSVAVGAARSLEDMGLAVSVYGHASILQRLVWESSDTSVVTVGSTSGQITGVGNGSATIVGRRTMDDGSVPYVTINIDVYFENGEYFIKNKMYAQHMQIDDATSSDNYETQNADIEQWSFRGEEQQKWVLTSLDNNYYKVISAKSGLALSVTIGEEGTLGTIIEQRSYTGDYTQQWKFIITSSGNYRIVPRSAEVNSNNLTITATTPSGSEQLEKGGSKIIQSTYSDNSTYDDEWEFAQIMWKSDVEIVPQIQSNWCWVASAKMLIQHYDPNYNPPLEEVYCSGMTIGYDSTIDYYTSTYNNTGTETDTSKAIVNMLYQRNNDFPMPVSTSVFSEETLIQLLDGEHVLIISRGYYEKNNGVLNRLSGHDTVICGYVKKGDHYEFIINNPGPIETGSAELLIYGDIYNHFSVDEDATFGYIWESTVLLESEYSSQSIPNYFENLN